MHEMHRHLEQLLHDVPRQLIARAIREKLVEAGVEPSDSLVEQLVAHTLSGSEERFTWDDDSDESADVSISLTDEDVASWMGEYEALLAQLPTMIAEASDAIAPIVLGTLEENWPPEHLEQSSMLAGFRDRLEERWGTALAKLRMLLTLAREIGSEHAASVPDNHVMLHGVLTRLHARACQVAAEIVALLENGYADGAMARWRTLHEIGIVTVLMTEHGDTLAERYVAHQAVESKAGMDQFKLCHAQLGYPPLTEEETRAIDQAFDEVVARFGKEFSGSYGWAEGFVPKSRRGRVSLAELEAAAGRSALASHYKLASHNVHAGPHALFFRLGLMDENVLLSGPSNAGLSEPGVNTAISIGLITILGVADNTTLDGIVAMKIVALLERDVAKAFSDAEALLQSEHAERMRLSGQQFVSRSRRARALTRALSMRPKRL